VKLKIEEDGRMFPVSDSSATIIHCFLEEAKKRGIKIYKGFPVKDFEYESDSWKITGLNKMLVAKQMVICTGSNPKVWKLLEKLGHTIVKPVPSLFTFNCKDSRIKGLAGISTKALVKIKFNTTKAPKLRQALETDGPLLITHWGMSGPAILKLSAWGARALASCSYKFCVVVNWLPDLNYEKCLSVLEKERNINPGKTVCNSKPFNLPKRLWVSLLNFDKIGSEKRWSEMSNKDLQNLADQLTSGEFQINGKSTFKEEFVTAGGVELKEIDFRTYKSKMMPNLYLAGEVLNIDAVTGGFNFQNAWTGAYIAAKAMANAS
jgi:predicted Rossmann fold flavoprotein